MPTEADTCRRYVVPALQRAGWDAEPHAIAEQRTICERFLDSRSRTVDQMVQAARSGRQNIAEGSRASASSSHTELRLLNVARASLEELLLDYEDYLRHRHLPQWPADGPEASAVRAVVRSFRKDPADPTDLTDLSDQERWQLYSPWLDHEDGAVRANAAICLMRQSRSRDPVVFGGTHGGAGSL